MMLTRRLCLSLPKMAMGVEFDVAPQGSDIAPGTHDQPLATLVTAIAKAGPFLGRESEVINLAPGVHRLTQPVVLGAPESGTAAAPFVISGAPRGFRSYPSFRHQPFATSTRATLSKSPEIL